MIKKSKLTNNEMLYAFLMVNAKEYRTFLHVTDTEENAKSICENGFRYVDNFYKTVDEFYNGNIDTLNWLRIQRQAYGKFVIIIQIDKEVFKSCGHDIDHLGVAAGKNSDEEDVTVMKREYVHGYLNENNQTIKVNTFFNPNLSPFKKLKDV